MLYCNTPNLGLNPSLIISYVAIHNYLCCMGVVLSTWVKLLTDLQNLGCEFVTCAAPAWWSRDQSAKRWCCEIGQSVRVSRPCGRAVLKKVQLSVVEFHTESCAAMSAECWTVTRVCETVHSTELLMLSRHELVFAALCL